MQILAVSSSRVGDGGYLSAAAHFIESFLGKAPLQIAFVPFAAVDGDYEEYAANVRKGLSSLPHALVLATPHNAKEVISESNAIVVGGGNTFKLLHDIYALNLFSLIQQKVKNGTPYIGWSAGANLTGRSISTTNDMPIIQPPSFEAFHFFTFQINPHYYNVVMEGFHGETRDQRLVEYVQMNPLVPVVALPEGTALQLRHQQLHFIGGRPAALFRATANTKWTKSEIAPGDDLSALLQ